jgi:hypothetical protein
MDIADYTKRIKALRDEITRAETVKDIKEKELEVLLTDFKNTSTEVKTKYGIGVNKLQSLYDSTDQTLVEKLGEAEQILSEIKNAE